MKSTPACFTLSFFGSAAPLSLSLVDDDDTLPLSLFDLPAGALFKEKTGQKRNATTQHKPRKKHDFLEKKTWENGQNATSKSESSCSP